MSDSTDPKTGYPLFVLGDVKFGITEPFPVTAPSEPISLDTPKRRRGETKTAFDARVAGVYATREHFAAEARKAMYEIAARLTVQTPLHVTFTWGERATKQKS